MTPRGLRKTVSACTLGVLLALPVLGACSASSTHPTEIMVVVDTDLVVPDELDEVRVTIQAADDRDVRQQIEKLATPKELPLTLGIVHPSSSGVLSGMLVIATGLHAGTNVIQRAARVDFVKGRVLTLRLDLRRVCQTYRACSPDQTCVPTSCDRDGACTPQCRALTVAGSELEPWMGTPARITTGSSSGNGSNAGNGGGVAGNAGANGGTSGIGGGVAGTGATGADGGVTNGSCSASGASCPLLAASMNASNICVGDSCQPQCNPAYGDCDGNPGNGCEQSLGAPQNCGGCGIRCADPTPLCNTNGVQFACVSSCSASTMLCSGRCVDLQRDAQNCGGCGTVCNTPQAFAGCSSGQCAVGLCFYRWADCNSDPSDGCEANFDSDANNCGSCGNACPSSPPDASGTRCNNGTCKVTGCVGMYSDCNGKANDGCEVDVRSDMSNCGGCGKICDASPSGATGASCQSGHCTLEGCQPNRDDCDNSAGNGCEVDLLTDVNHCGACGTSCTSDQQCCNGTCIDAMKPCK
jgi:hypothetical protein